MNTKTRFRLFRLYFSIVGNPILGDGQSAAYWLYMSVMIIIIYGCWMGVIIETLRNLGSFEKAFECAKVSISVTASCWVDFSMRIHRQSIQKLLLQTEQFTWEDLPERNDSGSITMAGIIPLIQKVLMYLPRMILIAHSIHMLIRGIGTEKLGLDMWLPFDTSSSPVHEIVVIVQVYSTVAYVLCYWGFVALYGTLVAISCSQLQKIQTGLRNFRKESLVDPDTELEELHEYVRLHQDILSFMRALEDTLSIVVFGNFLIIVGAICFCVISAVTVWRGFRDLMQTIGFSSALMCQLCIYCLFGDELMRQAENIKHAIWESEWVGAPLSLQRSLKFMMAAANKEFVLTAGGFAPLTRRTFVMVLNETMSYVMFLINFREEPDQM